jgi:hypothetical protein
MRNVSVLCLVIGVGLVLGGCGDDEPAGGSDAGGQGGGGGSGGSSGSDGSTSDPGLPDDTAGKACTDAAECGGGTCATTVLGTMIGGDPLPAPGGYCTATCTSNTDCGAGGACIGAVMGFAEGTCMATCSGDDCRDGYICGGGIMILGVTIPDTCRPRPATDQLDDDVAGKMCMEDDECAGGSCLLERPTIGGAVAIPGGYCSGACLEDAHCGAGGVCVDSLLGGAGSCYEACASDPDCTREGFRCRPLLGDVRGCNPAADPLPDNTAGDACASDTDCGGAMGTCRSALPETGLEGLAGATRAAPGGYCSQSCLEDLDCGAGGICVVGTCFAPCSVPTDCRDGYTCEERASGAVDPDAGLLSVSVCAPEPSDDNDGGM